MIIMKKKHDGERGKKGEPADCRPHLMVAVDHLLLGEHLHLASGEEVRPLQRPWRAEGPARTAWTLHIEMTITTKKIKTLSINWSRNEEDQRIRAWTNLVLDGPDGAVVPPVEVIG
jgi:hypothetical protein